MEPCKIEANEAFFTSLITLLTEGGTYGWPATGETFTLINGKLCGSVRGLVEANHIVSEKFFIGNFTLI
jgi:hypothetical protein